MKILTLTEAMRNLGKINSIRTAIAATLVHFPLLASAAADRYVDQNSPLPTAPYTNWTIAASTIQEAVDVSADGDTIWVTNGVYETGGRVMHGTTTNRVVIDKALVVRSINGPAFTVIKGNGPLGSSAIRCAYVGHNALLAGFTLTNGHVQAGANYFTNSTGGGAWCEVDGVVSNCVIAGNTAYGGGGAYGGVLYDCLLLENVALETGGGAHSSILHACTVKDNLSYWRGGGADRSSLYGTTVCGNLAVENGGGTFQSILSYCRFTANAAIENGGAAAYGSAQDCTYSDNFADQGGGTHEVVASNCTYIGNAAHRGGGSSGGLLRDCVLSGNFASENGGGAYGGSLTNCILIDNWVDEGNGGGVHSADLTDCIVQRNHAEDGGGAYGGFLRTCQVLGNTGENGGGVYRSTVYDSIIAENDASDDGGGSDRSTLINCTVVYNTAWRGGGVTISTVENSIVYFNTASHAGNNYYSDIWNPATDFAYACTTPLPPGPGNTAAAPLFVGHDYRLTPESPCINAGDNTSVAGTFDLDGNPRVVGGIVDIGAYEYQSVEFMVIFVSPNGDDAADGRSWATAKATIQAGVDRTVSGGVVWVTNGVYSIGGRAVSGTMTNRVAIDRSVTVRSVNGPAVTIIEGQGPCGDGAVRCAYVGSDACLTGFTLKNGHTRSSGDWFLERSGGGVLCDSSGVVSNCVVTGNKADYGGGAARGGIIRNCILSGNEAERIGGGTDESTVERSIVSDNRTAVYGGGVFLSSARNCIISGNTSDYMGGGAQRSSVVNCAVVGNRARVAGGGAGAAWFVNSIVLFNTAGQDDNYMVTWLGESPLSTLNHCCTTPLPTGEGNITADPRFINTNGWSDLRLAPGSPCINAGTNEAWMTGATDLEGQPRIIGGIVDIGIHESTNGATAAGIPWGWLLDQGFATDGSADMEDPDEDGMPNRDEYFADTLATNADSVLRFLSISEEFGGVRLDWKGGRDAWQFLEVREDLVTTTEQWKAIYGIPPPTPITNAVIDMGATNGVLFYRIRIER